MQYTYNKNINTYVHKVKGAVYIIQSILESDLGLHMAIGIWHPGNENGLQAANNANSQQC